MRIAGCLELTGEASGSREADRAARSRFRTQTCGNATAGISRRKMLAEFLAGLTIAIAVPARIEGARNSRQARQKWRTPTVIELKSSA
jgi:hypothetical protein